MANNYRPSSSGLTWNHTLHKWFFYWRWFKLAMSQFQVFFELIWQMSGKWSKTFTNAILLRFPLVFPLCQEGKRWRRGISFSFASFGWKFVVISKLKRTSKNFDQWKNLVPVETVLLVQPCWWALAPAIIHTSLCFFLIFNFYMYFDTVRTDCW